MPVLSKVRVAVGLVLAAAVGPYLHIAIGLLEEGDIGQKTAAGDRMKRLYPYHFPLMVNFFQYHQSNANTFPPLYFEKERAVILEHLQQFTLHPYFQLPDLPHNLSWHQMLHERVKMFRRRMDEQGMRDFEVEKDRCKMYAFYRKHNLPLLPLHGEWHSLTELHAAVRDGEAFRNVTSWPVFWKACHLTQSSSEATRAMHAPPTQAEAAELMSWLAAKWDQRADDFERVWAADGNAITQGIEPGFLLQAPMPLANKFVVKGRISVGLAEVRVEVLWGRAYLALMDGVTVFTRDGKTQDFSKVDLFSSSSSVIERHWFFEDGHHECVFSVAERAADAAGVDSIRIDIFMDRAQPKACVINENSLSSGMVYWGHEPYLTRMWVEPHASKLYKVRDTPLGVLEQ